MALMGLAAAAGVAAEVATVDHGLRPEAADEARMVAGRAAALGFAHEILHWDGRAASGNLPDAGRQARRRLLAEWAARRGLEAVVLAHTADDLAETFLMRLSRGAGVDGLSAMAGAFEAEGIRFLRPLLGVRRGALRAWLGGAGDRLGGGSDQCRPALRAHPCACGAGRAGAHRAERGTDRRSCGAYGRGAGGAGGGDRRASGGSGRGARRRAGAAARPGSAVRRAGRDLAAGAGGGDPVAGAGALWAARGAGDGAGRAAGRGQGGAVAGRAVLRSGGARSGLAARKKPWGRCGYPPVRSSMRAGGSRAWRNRIARSVRWGRRGLGNVRSGGARGCRGRRFWPRRRCGGARGWSLRPMPRGRRGFARFALCPRIRRRAGFYRIEPAVGMSTLEPMAAHTACAAP